MNQLIRITTDSQGGQVVSARDLYEFLEIREIRSKFADWVKNRIKKYRFEEGQDFTMLSKNLEIGRRQYLDRIKIPIP